jgi:succinoglycan biosynthesis transport protein ExoP
MSEPSTESNLHLFDYLRVLRVRWPIILVVFLLVVITTGVITFLMPKEYESKVMLQVQQNADFEVFQQGRGQGFDPRFTSTQFEIIQSKGILQPVITKLGLEKKWAEEYDLTSKELVYRKLKKMISLREVRNTDHISITVLSRDKEEAAAIANEIAIQYKQARVDEEERWLDRSLATLKQEVDNERANVEALRRKAQDIRIDKKINDVNPEGVDDAMQAVDRVLVTVEEQVATQKLAAAEAKAKYTNLSDMKDENMLRSIATLQEEDQTIQLILPQYQEALATEESLLKSGLGESHPMVKAQKARKEAFWSQLTQQIVSLREALKTRMKYTDDAATELEKVRDEIRATHQSARSEAIDYYEAKNDYINAKRILEAADTRLKTAIVEQRMPMNPAIIWETAEPAEYPSRPRIFLNMALGIFFGFVLGFGVAFFIEYLDTSVKTMEDIERFFGLPVLAVVPRGIGVLMDEPPDTPDAEPYRILRTNIEFNRKTPAANTMTLVSGGAGEGKTTTLVNLAFAFAQSGFRTLIVDADLRRPRQHSIFGVSNSRGLTDYLSKGVPIEELILSTKVENLEMVPSGRLPAGAIGMLNSRRMTDLITHLKKTYDMVLFDAPPILGVSDSAVIVRSVDMTAIVIQHRRFPRSMLIRVKNAVLNTGGHLLGAILNNVDIRMDQYYQYQTNYYGYYHKPVQEEPAHAAKSKSKSKPAAPLVTQGRGASSGRSAEDEY